MIVEVVIVTAVVFGINLLPAFGPPTWAVLVYFRFRYGDIPVAVLIIVGAGAATAGRFVLARAFGRFGRKLPAKRTESLEVLGRALAQSKGGLVSTFLFFVFAPVPSAQMFEAAGLAKVRLGPLLAAFFIGRLVSYSLYVGAASAARGGLEKLLQKGLTSPQAIATQLISIALLVVFVKVDWPSTIDRLRAWWAARRGRPKPPPIRDSLMPDP